MMLKHLFWLLLGIITGTTTLKAQKASTTNNKPSEAAFRAAILPGWGQIYNKKYWKLPIVYAGTAAIGYGIYWNNQYYQYFKNLYQEAFLTGNPQQINLNAAEALRNQFRRNKEQLIIAGVIFYGLTIVDAIVDAHFATYDISDDLSLQVKPSLLCTLPNNLPAFGIIFSWKVKGAYKCPSKTMPRSLRI